MALAYSEAASVQQLFPVIISNRTIEWLAPVIKLHINPNKFVCSNYDFGVSLKCVFNEK